MSRSRPVQISIDEELLARVDADAETRASGRSAFVRSALEFYLGAKEQTEIDEALRAAYTGRADEELSEAMPLMEGQAWPPE
jgi:metal-responsive CopG/Arc/MetJ family transcriptional regulator